MRGGGLSQINNAFVTQLNATTGGLAVFNASEADQSSAEDARWGAATACSPITCCRGWRARPTRTATTS